MKHIEDMIKLGICVLCPTYEKNVGNVTRIITKDGKIFMDQRTMKTILKVIAKYHEVHIETYREKYAKMLHQRLNLPIFLNKKLLLVPFKMRRPKFKKDGAKGYINLYDIEKIIEKETNTLVKLKNNIEITVLSKLKTVQNQINKAKFIEREVDLKTKDDPLNEIEDFYTEYKRPATKGDVARLQEEIEKLADALKNILH
ncbi:MAG: competence protein ComK [Marinisporobacter sp.]|jgi:hypothetical protein|nr:competence protein ComK [Marinisporobacter sp.]